MRRPLPTEPLLDVHVARARVLDRVDVLEAIEMPLEKALGHVTADEIRAAHPMPRFDNSAMDGYAIRSVDTKGAGPIELEVVGEIRAGDAPSRELPPGCAMKIMTGAVVPPGADAVVEVEETGGDDRRVAILIPIDRARNIRPAGDDFAAGDLLIRRGTEIGAGEAALLASIGATPVRVHRRPRVAILVTGDEIVPPDIEPGPGQIRDSNSIALGALVADAGGEMVSLQHVRDDFDAHVDAFEGAAHGADLIVSSGGVAVGDFDFVKDAVERLGAIDLWRVAMQPGKPVVLGDVRGVAFLGLPGNPVSVHVSFEQFVRPAVRKMLGCKTLLRPTIEASLADSLQKRAGRLHFVRVRLSRDERGWVATPTGAQGSHVQTSLVECDGVARFDKDATSLDAGERVTVEVWRLPADG